MIGSIISRNSARLVLIYIREYLRVGNNVYNKVWGKVFDYMLFSKTVLGIAIEVKLYGVTNK